MQSLPIDSLLPDVVLSLKRGTRLVLRAPPGAGKTTRVPAAILDAGLAGDRDVVVLEPRRIAARAAADFVARTRGGSAGGEVGYRVRFEQRGGARTRLWFVTEGVFSRQLAVDPFLERVAAVVLDEFHERHLQGDVALAVVRELQATVRPDLKLVVMSATLDTDAIAAALGDCVVLTSEGRAHPVEIEHDDTDPRTPLAARVAAALGRELRRAGGAAGDILIFLPGAAEIRRVARAIDALMAARGIDVVLLHGTLPLEAQQHALGAGPRRRVILSTNVAETALTVEGVTTVIDSGLARIARLDARHGINTLRTAPISQASAAQRAGRAGRLGPGRCIRLWSRADHIGRRPAETPEVLRLDLTGLVLELRGWGLRQDTGLPWLDPPPPVALAAAEHLLIQLGAVDAGGAVGACSGTLTETGRRMLVVPAPPRVARMLVEAERRGCAADGALLAALASERDVLLEAHRVEGGRGSDRPAGPSDLLLRLDLVRDAARRGSSDASLRAAGLDPGAVHTVERTRRHLERGLRGTRGPGTRAREPADDLLRCTLAGFPDRVARRRAPGSPRALMVGGRGVVLSAESVVREAELFVAVDVETGAGVGMTAPEARVRVASAMRREWLAELFPAAFVEETDVVFDPERERVVARTRTCYHDLVLEERVSTDVDPQRAGETLAAAARAEPERAFRIGAAERALATRIAFCRRWRPDLGFPEIAGPLPPADLADGLCAGRRSFAETRGIDVAAALARCLTPAQRARLERDAPTDLVLPSGRHAPVVYEADKPPSVAARIQEVFGLRSTPRLAGGQVPLVITLLAPNQRPVQITDDLESFWRTTYPEVRKQLRGRYPKHPWPEDPLVAAPTSSRRRR